MTIIESIQILLKWYTSNNLFNLDSDFKKLFSTENIYLTDKPEEEKCAILGALSELTDNNIIKKIDLNDKDYYILCKPLNSINQTLSISIITSVIISEVINTYASNSDKKELLVNPLQLTEQNILTAVTLLTEKLNIK